jgi:hypothetical protein
MKRPIEQMAMLSVAQILKWINKEEKFKPCKIQCEESLILQGTTRQGGGDLTGQVL